MREGWRTAKLGDLFEPSNTRLGAHSAEPPVFSVSKYDGVIRAEDFFGKRVASADLSTYKLLPDQAWVYSTIHIDEGSIARNNLDVDGVVSPMYTVMNWISVLDDPRYVEHLLRSREMLATYADNAQGSINRRRSLAWKSFSQIEVVLPTAETQKRIVDLIARVDDAIEAAETESVSASALLARCRNQAFTSGQDLRPADSMFEIVIGKQRTAAKVEGDNMVPYLRSANVELGRINLDDVLFMNFTDREIDRLALADGDVLVTEGSASENAVGVPAVWRGELEGVVGIQNALIRIRAVPGVTIPSFAEHWAFWAYESGTFREIANGTNIKHVGVERARTVRVPLIDPELQLDLVAPMDAARDVADTARTHADALRTLRSNLLTVLLSGEHEIPSSYDQFLNLDEEAAA